MQPCTLRRPDINITVEALKRAASLICEICGGQISSAIVDVYPAPVKGHTVVISLARINKLAGAAIPVATVKNILQKLEIAIEKEEGDVLTLLVPTFKADVTREADIPEEILRIYGCNSIPMPRRFTHHCHFHRRWTIYDWRILLLIC
jgi:phenylalanyl-tRNA synthetase beta chain